MTPVRGFLSVFERLIEASILRSNHLRLPRRRAEEGVCRLNQPEPPRYPSSPSGPGRERSNASIHFYLCGNIKIPIDPSNQCWGSEAGGSDRSVQGISAGSFRLDLVGPDPSDQSCFYSGLNMQMSPSQSGESAPVFGSSPPRLLKWFLLSNIQTHHQSSEV